MDLTSLSNAGTTISIFAALAWWLKPWCEKFFQKHFDLIDTMKAQLTTIPALIEVAKCKMSTEAEAMDMRQKFLENYERIKHIEERILSLETKP